MKGKKLPAARSDEGRILSDREEEEEEEDDEEEAGAAEQRRRVSGPGWPARAGQGLGTPLERGAGVGGRRDGREEAPGARSRQTPGRRVSQAKQISPELSALAVYCGATRLRTLRPAPPPPPPGQVSSLSERKAKKLIREAGRKRDVGHLGQEGRGDLQAPGGWGMLKMVWKGDGEGSGAVKSSGGPQRGAQSAHPVGLRGPRV